MQHERSSQVKFWVSLKYEILGSRLINKLGKHLRNDIGRLGSVLDLKCFFPLISLASEEVSQLEALMKQLESFLHK